MSRFEVGDIITAAPGNLGCYEVTDCESVLEVIEVTDERYIRVSVLNGRSEYYKGNIYSVESKYFIYHDPIFYEEQRKKAKQEKFLKFLKRVEGRHERKK